MATGRNLPISEIYSSPTFKFLVGPDKKEFFIHKSLVAKLSPALDALVNNGMKEAREGLVEWPDVDEETFSRFAEFAYTGDYPAAAPETLLTAGDIDSGTADEGPPSKRRKTGAGPRDRASAPPVPIIEIESDSEVDSEDESVSGSSGSEDDEGSDELSGSEDVSGSEEDSEDDERHGQSNGRNGNNGIIAGNGGDDWEEYHDDDDENDDDERRIHWCRSWSQPYRNVGVPHDSLQAVSECVHGGPEDPNHAKIPTAFCLPYSLKSFMRFDAEEHHKRTRPHPFNRANDTRCIHLRYADQCNEADERAGQIHLMRMLCHLPQPSAAEAALNYTPPDFAVPRLNEKSEGFAPVLLCHARLWVMADVYDIPALRLLAATKLCCTLQWFTLHEDRVGDLVELARYVYENSCDAGDVVGLRPMVALYLAAVMEDVAHREEVREVLADVGELSRDVVMLMVRRVK